jgi:hypothetical protein
LGTGYRLAEVGPTLLWDMDFPLFLLKLSLTRQAAPAPRLWAAIFQPDQKFVRADVARPAFRAVSSLF